MLPSDGGDGGLYLSPVPVPTGDPAALSHAAATYTAAHGEISRNHAALTGAASQATGAAWQGTGAASYLTAVHDLAAMYALTSAALASGATALRSYATDLKTAQDTARRANAAVATANGAAGAMLAAQTTADQSQAAARDAADTSTRADAQATASPHSAQAHLAAANARLAAADAQTTATSDAGRLSSLSATYQADQSNALRLCSLAQQQASHAATKAGAAFDAATTGLVGKSVRPARGGATGVTGGKSGWQRLSDDLDTINDDAGWGLNTLNAYGVVMLTKAEVVLAEAQAGLGTARGGYDAAVDGVMADRGFFSTGYYGATDGLNTAFRVRRAANTGLMDSIRPTTTDFSALGNASRGLLGVGMLSDLWTMKDPDKSFGPDGKLGGNTDRAMAAANLVASGVALGASMDVGLASAVLLLPGAPVVVGAVLVGTALYFGGEFVYKHWDDISGAASTATHAAGTALSDTGHFAGHEIDSAGHELKKAFSWL
jgi:hypothetical protein